MEENKVEINESNASKRLRMLGQDMDEKIHSEDEEIKKGNFWHNLWYRYKWHIIFLAALILFTVPVIMWCSQGKKDQEDVLIYYVGPVQITDTTQHNSITNAFKELVKDYDGNGKAVVQVASSTLYANNQLVTEDGKPFTTTEIGKNSENINTFKNQLMSGEFAIILIDKSLYEQEFKGQFCVLADLGVDAGGAEYDSNALYLKKTEFGKYYAGLSHLPDDTLIVVNQKLWNSDEDKYESQIDYLKTLVATTIDVD